jgi:hypothetical protein
MGFMGTTFQPNTHMNTFIDPDIDEMNDLNKVIKKFQIKPDGTGGGNLRSKMIQKSLSQFA